MVLPLGKRAGLTVVGAVVVLSVIGIGIVRPVYWRYEAEYLRPFRSQLINSQFWSRTASPALKQGAGPPSQTKAEPEAAPPATPPSPSPSPVPLDPRAALTEKRVKGLAQDGYLFVTWANNHYADFVFSWVNHIQAAGITGYMVGAMDDLLLERLLEANVSCFSMLAGLPTDDFGWGTRAFAKMGRSKIQLIPLFLDFGVQLVLSDVDVAWLRSPIPFFKRFPTADLLTSTDHLASSVGNEEQLEQFPVAHSSANIGIMLFRKGSQQLVEEWIKMILKDEEIWDQNAFNDILKRNVQVPNDNTQNLFLGNNGTVRAGILPVAYFMSGHTYFTQRLHKTLGTQPYAVHATFQFSGTPGKRHRFREALLWKSDPPEYYDPPGGLLTFKQKIPPLLLSNAGPRTNQMDLDNIVGHFELANLQLRRVREGLALAHILGRALIMPELWCGLDRYWAPHAGTIPGSDFKLPFKCPMDHVMDLTSGWTAPLPEDQYGPTIAFREHSFLRNPAVPLKVHKAQVTVEVCDDATKAQCSDGSEPAPIKDGKVRIQPGLKSDRLAKALGNARSAPLLAFSSVDGLLSGFADEQEGKRFEARMRLYAALWCCVDAHPGHIHYDLLWDRPHQDRFQRQWDKWNITLGP